MIEPTDLDWLALCLVTESNRPDEWPYIAQVIENRRATGRWGNTYKSVVLAPKQFSAFNVFTEHGKDSYLGTLGMFGVMARREDILLLMHSAVYVTLAIDPSGSINARPISADISPTTLHYYSPVSMKPAGSKPAWAGSAKRLYTPESVDPNRFIFAEGVT